MIKVITIPILLMALACAAAAASDDVAFQNQFEQGKQALATGKYAEAISALKKANKMKQENCAECYLLMAVSYFRGGLQNEGFKYCDRVIATATDDSMKAEAYNLRANALLHSGDPKKLGSAEEDYRRALQLQPGNAIMHLNLAKALFMEMKDDDGRKETEACLKLQPDALTMKQAQLYLQDARRARSEFAPEFQFVSSQGERVASKQLEGHIVVLDFWATWCPPCRESVPELKELTRKYPREKLTLISISADDNALAWEEYIAKKHMDWIQYRDADHRIRTMFGVNSFPTYLLIDGDGIIRQRMTGLNPNESVVHRLKATLAQMPQLEGEGK